MKQSLKEQLDNKEAKNPTEVKRLFPFVVTKNYKQFSRWHCTEVTFTDYGFKKNDKTYWFGRRTSNEDQSYDYDDILFLLNNLQKNDFKFACNYCGKGMLGSPNKFLNPFDFIEWMKENNYQFDKHMTTMQKIDNGYWRFSGNLVQCSCAFWFDIFDKDILEKIIKGTGLKPGV